MVARPAMNMVKVMAFSLVAAAAMLLPAQSTTTTDVVGGQVAVTVGVVMGDMDELPENMTWTTLSMAVSDFYATHRNYTTRLLLHRRSSPTNDVITSAAAVLDLIKNVQVQAIIGPETSIEAQFDMSLADKAQVPMISYAATGPLLSPMPTPYFIQATQLDSAQISAISSIVQAFRWPQVVIFYVRDDFGDGFVSALVEALQFTSTRATYRSEFSSTATDDQIEKELYKFKSMDTRVFIVHMNPKLGFRLFSHAKKIGMMDQDYAWIITTGMADLLNSLKSDKIKTMQGVIGVRNYFPTTPELEDFVARWKRRIVRENLDLVDPQISVFQLWAYDAITALASAVEKVRSSSFKFEKRATSSNISVTDLSTFGVSKAGPELIRAIQTTRFKGLTGDFDLVDGKLKPSILEIINVVGNGEKIVGFWTPKHGLSRELNSTNSVSSGEQLGSIIWPGDINYPPKGWVVSPNGKRLKVLVPVKDGFQEFVKVTPSSGPGLLDNPQISGYCIDIFDAVMGSLPYPAAYDYFPYTKQNGDATYSYDELITEVYNHRYDVVVGDVTIIANRSEFVDFTLPYTESGVTMVAPLKDSNKKKAWLFLTPLSSDLWVTFLCFFVFIAFVIWAVEHRINPQFRGPLVYQAGTSLYYSFSTMVFAHSQEVFSNATRFVVIIWVFLVLIVTQCYTASLTSILTIQQLQPTVTDLRELINTGKVVGYQEGSFVKDLLIKKGFAPSNLKSYKSPQELDYFLTKGSEKGGVAAAFDEIPYLNVFLASYCSKYTMVPPTYKTDGFGFVFPLGSPLVADVSRKVLNVTEGDQMEAIERKWFVQNASCSDSTSTSISTSTGIGLDSFWGLFLIAGCVAALALILSLVKFLYEYRSIWLRPDPNATFWSRVKELAWIFDQRNMSSHTFKISEPHDMSCVRSPRSSQCPQSPLSFSNQTESTSPGHLSQQTLDSSSSEYLNQNEESVVEIVNA